MRLLLILLTTAAVAACNAPGGHEAAAATQSAHTTATATVAPNDGFIPGTPAGDLGDWVRDIRSGIAELPDLARSNAAAAQRKALDLYLTRQEFSEMYYGVDGRQRATDALATAIKTAEDQFHELLKLLGTSAPAPVAVRAAVDALDAQQAAVATLWQQSGAHLKRPMSP